MPKGIISSDKLDYDSACNSSVRHINAYYRSIDQSHLYPVNGRFNATERAIRRLRLTGMYAEGGLDYFGALDTEISNIVNGVV